MIGGRAAPPGKWAVYGVVAIFFADAALDWFGTVAEGVAKLIAVEANHIGAGTGDLIRQITFAAGRNLAFMLNTRRCLRAPSSSS